MAYTRQMPRVKARSSRKSDSRSDADNARRHTIHMYMIQLGYVVE